MGKYWVDITGEMSKQLRDQLTPEDGEILFYKRYKEFEYGCFPSALFMSLLVAGVAFYFRIHDTGGLCVSGFVVVALFCLAFLYGLAFGTIEYVLTKRRLVRRICPLLGHPYTKSDFVRNFIRSEIHGSGFGGSRVVLYFISGMVNFPYAGALNLEVVQELVDLLTRLRM
jgi:hypothetical protein